MLSFIFCDSMWSFWVEAFRFFSIAKGVPIMKRRGYRFYPATFVCLSQARTWISNVICHGLFFCSIIWGERSLWEVIVRGDCERWLWEVIVRGDCERSLWEVIVRGHCERSLWEVIGVFWFFVVVDIRIIYYHKLNSLFIKSYSAKTFFQLKSINSNFLCLNCLQKYCQCQF